MYSLKSLLTQDIQNPTIHQFWLWSAGLISILWCYLFFTIDNNYFDDAHMFVRYADNYLATGIISWNRDFSDLTSDSLPKGIYGCTSLVFFWFIVGLRFLFNISSILTVKIASFAFCLASLITIFITIKLIFKNKTSLTTFARSFTLLTLCSPILYHSNTGMDTTASFFANALLIFFTLKFIASEKTRFLLAISTSAFICFAIRPDSGLIATLFPAGALLLLMPKSRQRFRHLIIFGFTFLLLIGADAYWKLSVFNDILPLAFYAKKNGFYEGYIGGHQWNKIFYLSSFLLSSIVFLRHLDIKNKHHLLLCSVFLGPVLLTCMYYASVNQIMGYFARYYFPMIVFPLVLGTLLYKDKTSKDRQTSSVKMFTLTLAALLILVATSPLLWSKFHTSENVYPSVTKQKYQKKIPELNASRFKIIDALTDFSNKMPAGFKLSLSEYGLLGARSPNTVIIDPIGLHDPYLAHNGFDVDYFLEQKPDLIWLVHSDYTKIHSIIIDNAQFLTDYDFYPTAFRHGLAIRKDSKHHKKINEEFPVLWRAVHGTEDWNDYIYNE